MLNDTKIRAAKPKDKMYRLMDGNGLVIEIKPNGRKIWRYRYVIAGKETTMTLGDYPDISLMEARRLHQSAYSLAKNKIDPVQQRKEEHAKTHQLQQNTFEAIYLEWVADRIASKSASYRATIEGTTRRDILPTLGHRPIHEITSAEVLSTINNTIKRVQKESNRKNATGKSAAINVRQIIGSVIQYAIQTLRADTDHTYPLRRLVQRPDIQHARALSETELKHLFTALTGYNGSSAVKGCITILMYTMTRTIEARKAEWSEIDLDNGLWTIPAEKMKKRRTHLIPLPTQIIGLLRAQRQYTGEKWVFPSPKDPRQPISVTTVNRALQYMECANITGHDFRATASTILNSNGFNGDWIERQLAHVEGNAVRRSYNHADYLPDRRVMLQWWADYLDGLRCKT